MSNSVPHPSKWWRKKAKKGHRDISWWQRIALCSCSCFFDSFHKCEFFFGSVFRALCLYFMCAYFGFQYTIGILFTNWQHVRVLFFCFSIFFCDAVSRPIYKFSCVRAHVYVYVCMYICMSVCLYFPQVFWTISGSHHIQSFYTRLTSIMFVGGFRS